MQRPRRRRWLGWRRTTGILPRGAPDRGFLDPSIRGSYMIPEIIILESMPVLQVQAMMVWELM